MIEKIEILKNNISKVIIGKDDIIDKVIIALLCNGHVLIEDVPGVGKTKLVSALAQSLHGVFNRIQMTPDIMPSDIIGFSMIDKETGKLSYFTGAAICNFLLADEINRASPKAQSSLLEIMEEFQISIDSKTFPLPKPFMCLATQNPIESYGTYHLPEAQMDRFLMKISIGYPDYLDELKIIETHGNANAKEDIKPVLSLDDILEYQKEVTLIKAESNVKKYILDIITKTRNSEYIKLGASPRASIALFNASKANAFIKGKKYCSPDDVLELTTSILSHRIILTPKGKTTFDTPENVIKYITKNIQVPV